MARESGPTERAVEHEFTVPAATGEDRDGLPWVELLELDLDAEPTVEDPELWPTFTISLTLHVESEDGAEQEEAARRACSNVWNALEAHGSLGVKPRG